jgi:hypothetical protein
MRLFAVFIVGANPSCVIVFWNYIELATDYVAPVHQLRVGFLFRVLPVDGNT